MDLINTLSTQLGIPSDKAQAVAGGVLGMVKGQVADADPNAAAALDEAVPELSTWEKAAQSVAGGAEKKSGGMMGGLMGGGSSGGGMLGGLMGAAGGGGGALGALAGAVGGEDAKNTAMLVGVLNKVGLDASKAAMVAPIAYGFLKERLPEGLLGKVTAAAPFLTKFL